MGVLRVDFSKENLHTRIMELFSQDDEDLRRYAAIALGGICIVINIYHIFNF